MVHARQGDCSKELANDVEITEKGPQPTVVGDELEPIPHNNVPLVLLGLMLAEFLVGISHLISMLELISLHWAGDSSSS